MWTIQNFILQRFQSTLSFREVTNEQSEFYLLFHFSQSPNKCVNNDSNSEQHFAFVEMSQTRHLCGGGIKNS